jgi:hypothetical protein
MQVYMEDILPGFFSICQKEVHACTLYAALAQGGGNPLGNAEHVTAGGFVQIRQAGGVLVGDYQHVPGIDGLDIHECGAYLILVDPAGGGLVGQNSAENAGVHGFVSLSFL